MKYILGVTDSHDSGAALINEKGEIVCAINEERISRKKLDVGMPYKAIKNLLRRSGVDPKDIKLVALVTKDMFFSWNFNNHFYELRQNVSKKNLFSFLFGKLSCLTIPIYQTGITCWFSNIYRPSKNSLKKFLRSNRVNAPIEIVEHHLGHGAGAYFTGPQSKSLIITMDTTGDILCSTVSVGKDGKIKRLFEQKWPNTPTCLYSRVTQALGFKQMRHEGKILGLAAYGNSENLAKKFRKDVKYTNKIKCNWRYGSHMIGIDLVKKHAKDLPREDIAAACQTVTEEVTLRYVQDWVRKTGVKDLVVAGGLFANVKINQKILELPEVNSIFIHPGMGDGGLALGGAFAALAKRRKILPKSIDHSYFGFEYTEQEILQACKMHKLKPKKKKDMHKYIAKKLKEGKIVGLYQGRMEYGPRALGNRTILANPSDTSINDWLNKRLSRTEFMPFAPVVRKEDAKKCYNNIENCMYPAKFMTITVDVKPECRKKAPAVCHVDNTARPQVITRKDNPLYYDILTEFKKITKIPVLINTSFNMHEEPIVCSPSDAIRSYKAGAVDILILQDYIIE